MVIAKHAECLHICIDEPSLFICKQNADRCRLRKEAVSLFGELQSLLYARALLYLRAEFTVQFMALDGVAKDSSQLAALYLAFDDVIVGALSQRRDPQLFILQPRKDHDPRALRYWHDSPQ